jgi:alpha-tubulin suppressor-like RCC1 family protein
MTLSRPALRVTATLAAVAGVLIAATIDASADAAAPVPAPHTQVYSWGVDYTGQLGDGRTTDAFTPQPVRLPADVWQVTSGSDFGVALRGNGTVWSWGANYNGQLGNGSTDPDSNPRPVAGLRGIVQVSAGDWHVLALDGAGDVWSWGGNERGQLGDGTTDGELRPHRIAGLSGFIQVAAGGRTSLGLRADGSVWAWGANDWGELGDGTRTDNATPHQVPGIAGVVQVVSAIGGTHSVALRADGTVWGWGGNAFGQLGNNSTGSWFVLAPLPALGVSGATQIAAGATDTLALVGGQVWGWGGNVFGELGVGDADARPVPAPIGFDGVAQVAIGYSQVAARRIDGAVWAAGDNFGSQGPNGSLGTGSTAPFTTAPAVVPGLADVARISVGFNFSAAVTTPGQPAVSLVPDLAGVGIDRARLRLGSVGLFGVGTGQSERCHTVLGQRPAPGSPAPIGTVVTLDLGCR